MDIENVKLMQESYLEHLRIETARLKYTEKQRKKVRNE